MPNESEYDDSSNVEEVDTPETTLLDSDEVLDPEEEILAKNRQLYERAKKAEQKAKELEDNLKTHVSDPYADNDDDWKDKFNHQPSPRESDAVPSNQVREASGERHFVWKGHIQ